MHELGFSYYKKTTKKQLFVVSANLKLTQYITPIAFADCQMNMVVSLHDYPAYGLGELTMRIGERLTIVTEYAI